MCIDLLLKKRRKKKWFSMVISNKKGLRRNYSRLFIQIYFTSHGDNINWHFQIKTEYFVLSEHTQKNIEDIHITHTKQLNRRRRRRKIEIKPDFFFHYRIRHKCYVYFKIYCDQYIISLLFFTVCTYPLFLTLLSCGRDFAEHFFSRLVFPIQYI